jgi:hypothetical protein
MFLRSSLPVLALSLLGSACGKAEPAPSPPSGQQPAQAPLVESKKRLSAEDLSVHQRGCKADDDCEVIRADCCGCPRGGANAAVLRGHKNAVDALLVCGGMFCAPTENVGCKADRAVCRDGVCTVEREPASAK